MLPTSPSELYHRGGSVSYGVLLGTTTEDTLAGPPWNLGKVPASMPELQSFLKTIISQVPQGSGLPPLEAAAKILAAYTDPRLPPPLGAAANASAAAVWQQINSDVCAVCPTRKLAAELSKTHVGDGTSRQTLPFLYQYAGSSPSGLADHGSTSAAVFGSRSGARGAETPCSPALSAAVGEFWTTFAAGGVPSAKAMPAWPGYRPAAALAGPQSGADFMRLGEAVTLRHGYKVSVSCDVWENFTEAVRNALCYVSAALHSAGSIANVRISPIRQHLTLETHPHRRRIRSRRGVESRSTLPRSWSS